MAYILIKPLSVNEAYRGRRFATPELTEYKRSLLWMLPKMEVPKGQLSVRYRFGVSSRQSDGDNLIKAFQDVIAEKYGFNDNTIYEWHVTKEIVEKGKEFVYFEISTYPACTVPTVRHNVDIKN